MRTSHLIVSILVLAGTANAKVKKTIKPKEPPPETATEPEQTSEQPAPAAPAEPPRSKVFGIDGGVAMPTGTWGDAVGFGIGALARFELPINDKLTFGARAGYIQHLSQDAPNGGGSSSAHEIPLLGGVRYAFSKSASSEIYGAAELGLVIYGVSVDFMGMSNSKSDTNFGTTLTGGYRAGKLDIRGGLLIPDLGHAGDALGIMATVGYDITAL